MGIRGLVLTLHHPQSRLDCSGHIRSSWLQQVIAGQGFCQTWRGNVRERRYQGHGLSQAET